MAKRNFAVGKTIVSSAIIDRVAKKLGREVVETPVGFKMVGRHGEIGGAFEFAGEESAGASFLRKDGVDHRQGRRYTPPRSPHKHNPSQLFNSLTAD